MRRIISSPSGPIGVRSMIVVEQRQRLDRRDLVGLPSQEQVDERRAHVVLRLARQIVVGEVQRCDAQRVQPLAPALSVRNRARSACAASSSPARRRASGSAASRARRSRSWAEACRRRAPPRRGSRSRATPACRRRSSRRRRTARPRPSRGSPPHRGARARARLSIIKGCGKSVGQARQRRVGDLQMPAAKRGFRHAPCARAPAIRRDRDAARDPRAPGRSARRSSFPAPPRSIRATARHVGRRRTRSRRCRYARRDSGPSVSRPRRAWSAAGGRSAAPGRPPASGGSGRASRRRSCWRDRSARARGARGWRPRASAARCRRAGAARWRGSFRPGYGSTTRNRDRRDPRRRRASAAGESATGMVGGVSDRPPGCVIVTRVVSMATDRSSMKGTSTRPDAVCKRLELDIGALVHHRASGGGRDRAPARRPRPDRSGSPCAWRRAAGSTSRNASRRPGCARSRWPSRWPRPAARSRPSDSSRRRRRRSARAASARCAGC